MQLDCCKILCFINPLYQNYLVKHVVEDSVNGTKGSVALVSREWLEQHNHRAEKCITDAGRLVVKIN